ncbi:DUF4157 domain-containing protein [Brasilonema sp. CT11]|nr:DUF4157 domain-containing protein [Brasilonema sp. CT11]
MTNKRIGQTNQQQKNDKPQGSGILQRAAVRSDSDGGVQFEEQEVLALSNSAFSKDFSQVPIRPVQKKQEATPNQTGLPDEIKAGVENLSGYSLDDVRVHYNSPKPAQLQALAYTQGTEIHVAAGQEEHLPHEAWHVVQQMQGRVKPTVQANSVAINDCARLEKESDVMGAKALQRASQDDMPSVENVNKLNNSTETPIQAKIELKSRISDIDPKNVMEHIKKRSPYFLRLITVFYEVVEKMPPEVQRECSMYYPHGITLDVFFRWIKEWHESQDTPFTYTDDEAGYTKLAKDVIKYHFYQEHHWISVGTAAYMTGDATGLSIAATIDPRLTIKVLKGQKSSRETEAPNLYRDDKLPSMFDEPKSMGKVRESDVNAKLAKEKSKRLEEDLYKDIFEEPKSEEDIEKFLADVEKEIGTGTADLYKSRFNEHTSKKLKPWNKETYHATKSVGDHYRDKQQEIINKLLPPKTDTVEEENAKIRHFKNNLGLGDSKCILIWQRLSGKNGGAHKELDSEPIVLMQIARAIGEKYSDYTIILVGDKTISQDSLEKVGVKNRIIYLHEYWNSLKEKGVSSTREHQNYFLKLLSTENRAISIGMRSGSLESSALLGIRTIYLDDLGNRAEGRMEFWAGDAAYKRGALIDQGDEELRKFEKEHEGPVPNYKRVATRNQLGSTADKRFKYFYEIYNTIENNKAIIQDQSGKNDESLNNAINDINLFQNQKSNLEIGKIPDQEPKLFKQLEKTLNKIKQIFISSKSIFSKDALEKFKEAIGKEMANSFLSENELKQIMHLIKYLAE